jgi:hypothetical protein
MRKEELTTVWITEEIKVTLEQTAGTPFKSFPWGFKEDHATRLAIVLFRLMGKMFHFVRDSIYWLLQYLMIC